MCNTIYDFYLMVCKFKILTVTISIVIHKVINHRSVFIRHYDKDGNQVSTSGTYNAPAGTSMIGVGPAQMFPGGIAPNNIVRSEVGYLIDGTIGPGLESTAYTIIYECCNCPITIAHRSLGGGWQGLSFEKNDTKIKSTQTEFCIDNGTIKPNNSLQWAKKNGFRIQEKTSFREYTFYKCIDNLPEIDESVIRYYQDFIDAKEYAVYYESQNGNTWIPFILRPGTFVVDSKSKTINITFTGYIPVPSFQPSNSF